MKRNALFITAVFTLLFIITGCSEVAPPEYNNPEDPLSSTYKIPVPSSLKIFYRNPNSIVLKWTEYFAYEKGFVVERSINKGPFEKISALPPNTDTYEESGLDAKNSYAYRVYAFTESAASKYSLTACLEPGGGLFMDETTYELNTSAAFSNKTNLLATANYLGKLENSTEIKLWTVPYKSFTNFNAGPYDILKTMAFSANDEILVGGSKNGSVYIWDVNTKMLSKTINTLKGEVNSLRFSSDGSFLAVASNDKDILIYDTKTWSAVRTLSQHTNSVNSVSFSRDGSLLASGSSDGTLILWNTSSWTVSRTITPGSSVRSVAFSPDGQIIAAASGIRYYQWETATGKQTGDLMTGGDNALSVAFSNDGKIFAGCCGSSIAFYDSNLQPCGISYATQPTKLYTYDNVIANPKDGVFISLGYYTLLWSNAPWKISYK